MHIFFFQSNPYLTRYAQIKFLSLFNPPLSVIPPPPPATALKVAVGLVLLSLLHS